MYCEDTVPFPLVFLVTQTLQTAVSVLHWVIKCKWAAICFYHIQEKGDISTAPLQLTPKQSRWINSTTSKRQKTYIFDLGVNCPFKLYINVRSRDLCLKSQPPKKKIQAFWIGFCCVPCYLTSHKALWAIFLTSLSPECLYCIDCALWEAVSCDWPYSFSSLCYISPNECWIA